jgi:HAD superfamily hydrolase (TIGR01509 family)
VKGIIFDMDGVLVDSMPAHVHAWKSAFAEIAGITVAEREIYLMEGMRGIELITKIFEQRGVKDDLLASRVHERKDRIFKSIRSSKPFKGVLEMIDKLECAKAVVSGSARRDVQAIINESFGTEKFSAIISADDVKSGKPDPSAFLAALSMMGIQPSDAVVVENAPLGVQAAESAGIECVVVLNNTPLTREDFGPARQDKIFERTSSVSEILRGMCE